MARKRKTPAVPAAPAVPLAEVEAAIGMPPVVEMGEGAWPNPAVGSVMHSAPEVVLTPEQEAERMAAIEEEMADHRAIPSDADLEAQAAYDVGPYAVDDPGAPTYADEAEEDGTVPSSGAALPVSVEPIDTVTLTIEWRANPRTGFMELAMDPIDTVIGHATEPVIIHKRAQPGTAESVLFEDGPIRGPVGSPSDVVLTWTGAWKWDDPSLVEVEVVPAGAPTTKKPLRWTRTDTASHAPNALVSRIREGAWSVRVDDREIGVARSREEGEGKVEGVRGER